MLWSRFLPIKFGARTTFESNLISNWPWLTLHNLSVKGVFLPNLVVIEHFWAMWPLYDPYVTFDPSNALYSGQVFFLPNLVVIGHSKDNLTSGWPLTFDGIASKIYSWSSWAHPLPYAKFQLDVSKHCETHGRTGTQTDKDKIVVFFITSVFTGAHNIGIIMLNNIISNSRWHLWFQYCFTLFSGDVHTKCSCHSLAFLSNLTHGWPQLTSAWPSTPAMHYALVRGSSYLI